MRKKIYLGFALLLITLLSLAIPLPAHASPDTGGDLPWVFPSGAGEAMKDIKWLNRLTFKSPISIIDSETNTEYRMNDQIFGDGSTTYLNNGGDDNAWYIYVPVDSKKQPIPNPNGGCLGVIAAELSESGEDMWLKAIQPERTTDGSECAIGGVSAKQGRVQGKIGDNERKRMYEIGSGNQQINSKESRWRNFVALFFWANKDSIRGFDTTQPDFKRATGAQLDTLKSAWENADSAFAPPLAVRRGVSLPNDTTRPWSFFQSDKCKNVVLVVSPSNTELYVFLPKTLASPPRPSSDLILPTINDSTKVLFKGFLECVFGRSVKGTSADLIGDSGDLIPTPIAYSENATLTAEQINASEFINSGTPTDPNNPAGLDETNPPVTCATSWRSALSWILCPVIGLAEEMIDEVDDFLRNFLFVNIGRFDTKGGLYKAWNTLRLISTIIIVVIALVMIFSEAMGAGIMDTYSVKKLLPRLVIAVIGIQLSWIITREVINIGNILGNGMQGLLLAPFEGLREQGLYGLLQVNEASGAAQGGLIVAGLAGTVAAFGAIATVAIAVLIALIIAFVTLIVRYMVIILCILFAPIAIAMSVLPGTQKTSKLWWESFEKAVLMYPIIMALLASGKIVSYGLIQAGQPPEGSPAGTKPDGWFILAAIVAYFAPYALIPAALKAGGTALNKLTGAFNDKSKGVFDRARDWNGRRQKVRQTLKSERNARLSGQGGLRGMYGKVAVRSQEGVPLTGGIKGRTIPGTEKKFLGKGNFNRYSSVVAGAADKANAQAVAEEKALLKASGVYSNAFMLLRQAQSGTPAQSRAAADRLVEMGADKELRMMRDGHSFDRNFNVDTSAETVARNQESRKRFTGMQATGATFSLKDKAPDVAMAKPAFDKTPIAPKMHDWSPDTLRLALEHEDSANGLTKYHNLQDILDYAENDPDFAATLDPEKTKILNEALYAMSGGAGPMPPGTMLFTPAKKTKL